MPKERRHYLAIVAGIAFVVAGLVAGAYWLGHTTATAATKSTTAAAQSSQATADLAAIQKTLAAVQKDVSVHSAELAQLQADSNQLAQILKDAGLVITYTDTELANLCRATRGCTLAPPPVLPPLPTTTTTVPRPAATPTPVTVAPHAAPTTTTTTRPGQGRRHKPTSTP